MTEQRIIPSTDGGAVVACSRWPKTVPLPDPGISR
jgi:hypothetical protein